MKPFCFAFFFTNILTSAFAADPDAATCSDKYLNDANSFSKDRWEAAGAQSEFERVVARWTENQNSNTRSNLSFSQFVSNEFNGNDMRHCENMGDGPCQDTLQCTDVNKPAGFLILNSFSGLHIMQRNIWESAEAAMNDMQNTMSKFQDTFSPAAEPKSNGWLSDLLTGVQLFVGVATAFTWNVAFKVAAESSSVFNFATGSAEAAIGFGFTWAKTHLPTATDLQNDLSTAVGNVFSTWVNSQVAFLRELFSGSEESLPLLEGLMKDGLALEITNNLDLGNLIVEAQKMMYAKLLPLAWRQSTRKIDDVPGSIYPMILMVPGDCTPSGDGLTWMVDSETAKNITVCHEGHTFFVGFPTFTGYSNSRNPTRLKLWGLPGGTPTELNGQDWGGLKLEDLVTSGVYDGYRLNGYKNGYDPSGLNMTSQDGNSVVAAGVLTPGFVNLPICTVGRVYTEAKNYITKRSIITGALNPGEVDTYPCGDGALTDEEMAAFGF